MNIFLQLIMNATISPSDSSIRNYSRTSIVDPATKKCVHQILPTDEARFALLANLYLSEGKPGKVIKVHAKKRIGKDDFIASIRNALAARYTDQLVGKFIMYDKLNFLFYNVFSVFT